VTDEDGGSQHSLTAEPGRTAATAGRLLDLCLVAGDRARALLSQLDVGDPAYGDLVEAGALADAHRRGVADAAQTLERLGQVLDSDADRLYQTAFAQREADLAAADRARTAGGG
jgi:hypothetical protein